MATVTKGIPLVFGLEPIQPIVGLEPGVIKIRIRQRVGEPTGLFVRYADRIESWYLRKPESGEPGPWTPFALRARNATA